MKNIDSNREKFIKTMLDKLRRMNKRGEKALKKADLLLEREAKLFQKELNSFKKKHNE